MIFGLALNFGDYLHSKVNSHLREGTEINVLIPELGRNAKPSLTSGLLKHSYQMTPLYLIAIILHMIIHGNIYVNYILAPL